MLKNRSTESIGRLVLAVASVLGVGVANGQDRVALSRLNIPGEGFHFYTTNCEEVRNVQRTGVFGYEGESGFLSVSQVEGTARLYRFWHPVEVHHLYTADETEAAEIKTRGWVEHGTEGYIATKQLDGTIPLFRWFGHKKGDQFYTTNPNEKPGGYTPHPNPIVGYVWQSGTSCANPKIIFRACSCNEGTWWKRKKIWESENCDEDMCYRDCRSKNYEGGSCY